MICDCHSKRKETAKSPSRSCSSLSLQMCSPLPCPPLSHPLSHLPHLPPLLVAIFLPQAIRDTLELLVPLASADLALSKPQSSDPSQSSLSTKTASQGPSLTPFNLSQFIFITRLRRSLFPHLQRHIRARLRQPTARPRYSKIPTPYDGDGKVIQLAWGWYSKVRPRTRSKTRWRRNLYNCCTIRN